VAWFRWLFLGRNPGYVRGRLRFLLDREPDPDSTRLPGIDPIVSENALAIIWRAFPIPKSQHYCLRPDDKLLELYRSIYPPGWPDCLDFNCLKSDLERAIHRCLSDGELLALSVGDVMRLLSSEGKATMHGT
jgi:hypothetical protein